MSQPHNDTPPGARDVGLTPDVKAFYESKAAGYRTLDSHIGSREERVLALFPQKPHLKVLDAGCGSGRFLRILKHLGHNATGVDLSEEAVCTACASGVSAFAGNLETREGFRETDSQYDVITLLDVLEHTFNPAAVMRGLLPRLNRDGCIIGSVPNIACIHARLTLLAGRFPSRSTGTFDSGHVRWFTRSTLEDCISQVGGLRLSGYTASPLPPCSHYGLWRVERMQNVALKNLAALWPCLWGYQHIFRLERA